MIGMLMAAASSGSVLAFDTFSRPNGAPGKDEIGKTWVAIEGTIAIVSNKAKGTVTGTNYAAINVGTPNCVAAADITWYTGETVALAIRGTSSNSDNQMRARITGTAITITKRIGGTNTDLATYNYTWASGATHKIKFSCIGDDFKLYLDGTLILTANDNNMLLLNIYAGILVSKTGVPATTFDNLLVTK